jgi:5-hydroxyisourate hydrolase
MSAITSHVLDTAHGRPAAGVRIVLELLHADGWLQLGSADTDADGRARALLPADLALTPGVYRLTFETAPYFAALRVPTFYPYVVVIVQIDSAQAHYHVPLLISPFGYTTYRGS